MSIPTRANLGCGKKYEEGAYNVDLYADKVDLRADLRTMELPVDHFERIRLRHVLEHFSYAEAFNLIRRCALALAPGGKVSVALPDRDKCLKLIKLGWRTQRRETVLRGAKGIMGGRDQHKDEWHEWLIQNNKTVFELARHGFLTSFESWKPEWHQHGEPHQYAWSEKELRKLFKEFGLKVAAVSGDDRDTEVTGVKDDHRVPAVQGVP